MAGTSWEFVLCKSGFRHVRVVNAGTVKFDGFVPAGFSMQLIVGDTVQSRGSDKNAWVTEYKVVLDKEGNPSIRQGSRRERRKLESLE